MTFRAEITAPDVAILIVSWNTRDQLSDCLRAIETQRGAVSVQTIVVDNGSSDDSPALVREQFPDVVLLVCKDNLGFVGGNNRAYAAADPRARYVLLLNPDAFLQAGALPRLVQYLDDHPQTGICGPMLLNSDGTLQPSWSRFPTIWSEIRGVQDRRFAQMRHIPVLTADTLRPLPPQSVGWLGGACLLARRSAIDGPLGGVLLDPDFHMYSEETDLCYRLQRAGWSAALVPEAEAIHAGGQSSRQSPVRSMGLLYRSKVLFFEKHYGKTHAGALRIGLAAASCLKWLAFLFLGLLPGAHRAALLQRERQRAVLQALHHERRCEGSGG